MYSQKLVELARSLDRMEMALAFANNDLECALSDAHPNDTDDQWEQRWAIPEKYLGGLEEAIEMIEGHFVDQLLAESQPYGSVELQDGRVIVPEWVSERLGAIRHDDYWTAERIRALVDDGCKAVHFGADRDGRYENVTVFGKHVPDSLIEVWWSRWARWSAIGRHRDICGFLSRVEGMGWQAFDVEQ